MAVYSWGRGRKKSPYTASAFVEMLQFQPRSKKVHSSTFENVYDFTDETTKQQSLFSKNVSSHYASQLSESGVFEYINASGQYTTQHMQTMFLARYGSTV
uniref:Uncharacterized protein n=1 Tax=Sphaerodactylus townsendi TaxID=933632 RepID=A0ACB8F769_9SAUR